MTTITILPLHSMAEIITNSSTEIFICNTERTVMQLMDFFHEAGKLIGRPHGVGEIEVYHGVDGLKEAIERLGVDYLYDGGFYKILNRFVPYSVLNLLEVPRLRSRYSDDDEDINQRRIETDSERDLRWEQEEQRRETDLQLACQWLITHAETLAPHINIVTLFRGYGDNSIPHVLHDIFDYVLKAVHFHDG